MTLTQQRLGHDVRQRERLDDQRFEQNREGRQEPPGRQEYYEKKMKEIQKEIKNEN